MRRWWIICYLMFAGVVTSAQTRDVLLERINQIKLDTEHYLYGICTLTDQSDQSVSEKEALASLSIQVSAYCQERNFSYIHALGDIPEEAITYISCALYENCVRSIAYLPKETLEQAESTRAAVLENNERASKVRHFVESLKEARRMEDIRELLLEEGPAISAISGTGFDNQSQEYAMKSFLVYYENSSIVEIMSPVNEKMVRHNLITGAIANPLKYKTMPLWIYIEGYSL